MQVFVSSDCPPDPAELFDCNAPQSAQIVAKNMMTEGCRLLLVNLYSSKADVWHLYPKYLAGQMAATFLICAWYMRSERHLTE